MSDKLPNPHKNPHKWEPAHVEAGYHLQKWIVPGPDADVIGTYDLAEGGVLEVKYLPVGPTGVPELHLDFVDGHDLTVLDEATVMAYLVRDGAVKR